MALSDIEKRIVDSLKADGYNDKDIISHVGALRAGRKSSIDAASELDKERVSRFSDLGEDISTTFGETVEGLGQRVEDIQAVANLPGERVAQARAEGRGIGGQALAGLGGFAEQAFVTGAQVPGGAFDIISAPFFAAGRAALTQEEEEGVGQAVGEAFSRTGIPQAISGLDERGQRLTRAGLSSLDVIGLGLFGRGARTVTRAFSPTATPERFVEDLADRVTKNLEEQVRATNPTARQLQDLAQANLTIKERLIGLTPDIKKRLQEMGEEQLGEYLNAARLRNVSDTPIPDAQGLVPEGTWGPQEVGAYYVRQAEEAMDNLIRQTGGEIGAVRAKLGDVRLPQTAIESIESSFLKELDKLNLELRNGVISQKPGKVSRVSGVGDINTMQDLYTEILTFKSNPSFANAIDLRMQFDNKVKFGKKASEVSNDVDPLSRAVRSQIADDTARFIGKDSAKDLQRYSEFMDAYGDLKSYTDRAAGSEYLLRLVLSGRGREARQVVETIKDNTGIDLMNHATGMKVAVDTLGNDAQKNLFRQEIAKAGTDLAAISTGSLPGIVGVVARRAVELGIDAEDVLRRAAAGGGVSAAFVIATNEDEYAPLVGLIAATANPLSRRQIAKEVAKKLDPATIGEMQDFNRAIRDGGVVTNNKGELVFKGIDGMSEKEVRRAFKNGIRVIEMDGDMFEQGFSSPGAIANFYDDVIEAAESQSAFISKKGKSATTKTTDLIEEARKYPDAESFIRSRNIEKNFDAKDRWSTGLSVKDERLPNGFEMRKQHYDVIGRENMMGIEVFDQNGKKVGKLSFGMTGDNIDIKMIEVIPEQRRKGIATVMLDKLQESYPDAKVSEGMRTEDGSALLQNYDWGKTRTQLEDIWKQANEVNE